MCYPFAAFPQAWSRADSRSATFTLDAVAEHTSQYPVREYEYGVYSVAE